LCETEQDYRVRTKTIPFFKFTDSARFFNDRKQHFLNSRYLTNLKKQCKQKQEKNWLRIKDAGREVKIQVSNLTGRTANERFPSAYPPWSLFPLTYEKNIYKIGHHYKHLEVFHFINHIHVQETGDEGTITSSLAR